VALLVDVALYNAVSDRARWPGDQPTPRCCGSAQIAGCCRHASRVRFRLLESHSWQVRM